MGQQEREEEGWSVNVLRLMMVMKAIWDGLHDDGDGGGDQVDINSLRRAIGVVPQDTVLFNETMR